MGLHLSLTKQQNETGIFVNDGGEIRELSWEQWNNAFPTLSPHASNEIVFEDQYETHISHNLTTMAIEGGFYETVWRPGDMQAWQIIPGLEKAIFKMEHEPMRFKQVERYKGEYNQLLNFLYEYLEACRNNPTCKIHAGR